MNGLLTTTFRATADPLAVYRGRLAVAIRDLKVRLEAGYERRFPGQGKQIRQAIAEAEIAAWHTEFPHLFLPDLVEEAFARFLVSSDAEQRDGIASFTNMA